MSAEERIGEDEASLSIFRQAPSLDGLKTAALGAFSCRTAKAGAALIRRAIDQLKAEGFEAALGPMDGGTWAKHRLVIESDGRAPFLMEPENPPHFVEAFERSGLKILSRWASAARPADLAPGSTPAPPGLRLRSFDPDKAEAELARIHALALLAFKANHFYAPISLEAFLESYRPILHLIDPDLVLMAEDEAGELKAFLFAMPDFAQGRQPKTVILKTYASQAKGGGSMLANALHTRARERGYAEIIHALMHESNLSAQHSAHTGSRVFRRYALWGGRL